MDSDGGLTEAEDNCQEDGAELTADSDDAQGLLSPRPAGVPQLPRSLWQATSVAAPILAPRLFRQARPEGRSRRMLLRQILDSNEAAMPRNRGHRWRHGLMAGGAAAGASLILALIMLLPSRVFLPENQTVAHPKHATELALECVRVASVGASITRGNVIILGGELASSSPYPEQLQRMLGPGYCVKNFGVPDATVLKQSRCPYWQQPELQQVSDFMPDIVVIQFGANDSRERNFERDFRPDYASMIQFLRGLPSRPRVYIMAMPPIYPGTASKDGVPGKRYGMDRDRVDNLRVPLELIAKENRLSPPISVLNSFKKHCPDMGGKCSWMAGDGVHPNTEGDAAMARLVHLTIRGDDLCVASDSNREPCGVASPNETQCKDQGCCYTPSTHADEPWCYRPPKAVHATPQECAADTDEKTDCGFEGETMRQCLGRGCCYKPSLDGTPWCFHKLQRRGPAMGAGAVFMKEISSTSVSTATTSTATTSTATTTTETRTGTVTTTSMAVTWQEGAQTARLASSGPVWLLAGGLLVLSTLLCIPCIKQVLPKSSPPEEKHVQDQTELDRRRAYEEEQQRQLRRLEVDQGNEQKRAQEAEQKRQLEALLDSGGFKAVNKPKTTKGIIRSGFTYPLHAAVEARSHEAIQLLLQANADPSVLDSKKRTPLMLAEHLNKRDSHANCITALSKPSSGYL